MSNIEKKIAIRGHKNRSVEVIDILKQLGGKNSYPLSGGYEGNIYFIDNYNVIDYMPLTIKDIDKYYQIYTLDEYLETLQQTEQIKSNNMEKKIAIQGHERRGAEVIKALEELGGRNIHAFVGTNVDDIYIIDKNNEIDCKAYSILYNKSYQIYTLEEYLESLQQTEQRNDKTQRQLSVDIETAKQWYKTNNEMLKQLALSVFTEEELTKVEFPTSWEEFCEQNSGVDCEYYINDTSEISLCSDTYRANENDKNLLETQEDAEAILALIQLKRLRDAWWKTLNYQPNWTDYKEVKYCISMCNDKIIHTTSSLNNEFLAFPTRESRNQFYTHFKDLIQKAKPFLS